MIPSGLLVFLWRVRFLNLDAERRSDVAPLAAPVASLYGRDGPNAVLPPSWR